MKNIIPIVIVLLVIIVGWNVFGKKSDSALTNATGTPSVADMGSMVPVMGEVRAAQDPAQAIAYSFMVPVEATTTTAMNGALVKVSEYEGSYASAYFSYNGGRGYTPADYVNKVIAPKVKVVNAVGETMIGNTIWFKAESEKTDWHVASLQDGKWLVVIESPKSESLDVERTLSSFEAQ
jgi:hypothetical protein